MNSPCMATFQVPGMPLFLGSGSPLEALGCRRSSLVRGGFFGSQRGHGAPTQRSGRGALRVRGQGRGISDQRESTSWLKFPLFKTLFGSRKSSCSSCKLQVLKLERSKLNQKMFDPISQRQRSCFYSRWGVCQNRGDPFGCVFLEGIKSPNMASVFLLVSLKKKENKRCPPIDEHDRFLTRNGFPVGKGVCALSC